MYLYKYIQMYVCISIYVCVYVRKKMTIQKLADFTQNSSQELLQVSHLANMLAECWNGYHLTHKVEICCNQCHDSTPMKHWQVIFIDNRAVLQQKINLKDQVLILHQHIHSDYAGKLKKVQIAEKNTHACVCAHAYYTSFYYITTPTKQCHTYNNYFSDHPIHWMEVKVQDCCFHHLLQGLEWLLAQSCSL